jgi:hypothetical protein
MSDPDYPRIETTGGDRPGNSLAERSIVVLAAVALVAGGLIALGNLVGKDKEVSRATPTPAAHQTPRPTPQPSAVPTPTPHEIVLLAGTPPSAAPSQGPWAFSGWIRALADQPTWPSASAAGTRIGVFSKGQIAYADEVGPISPGWLHIHDISGPYSYVQLAVGGTRLVEEISAVPVLSSGDIVSLAAGPRGFMALVNPPSLSDRAPRWFAAFSADGATWQRADLPSYISKVAWGPAGWLALGTIDDPSGSTMWVFTSSDGLGWTGLGAVAGVDGGIQYVDHLVGSETGYLMRSSGMDRDSLWFSQDGVTWLESGDPLSGAGISYRGDRHLAAIASGFIEWTNEGVAAPAAQVAFSRDGLGWVPLRNYPSGVNVNVTTLGDRIIAAVTDAQTGSVSFRTGAFHRSELIWDASSFSAGGAGVAALVSDTRKAIALLWERATDRLVEWTSTDGRAWQIQPLPDGTFGGIPRLAAAGPTGVLAVGYRQTMRGTNPIMWREIVSGTWAPEASPMLPVVPDPRPNACGPPPSDSLSFMLLDRALALACFGSAPLTFSGWSTACDGCSSASTGSEPAWLINPGANQLFLSPIAADIGGSNQVVLSPTLKLDPAWRYHWVQVTGHFDDPAAATCHGTPTPADDPYYSGQYWTVVSCRQQFVVTAVRVLNPP